MQNNIEGNFQKALRKLNTRLAPYIMSSVKCILINLIVELQFTFCPLNMCYYRSLNNKINRLNEWCLGVVQPDNSQISKVSKNAHKRKVCLFSTSKYQISSNWNIWRLQSYKFSYIEKIVYRSTALPINPFHATDLFFCFYVRDQLYEIG